MLSRRTDQSSPRHSRCRPDVKTKAVLDSLDVICHPDLNTKAVLDSLDVVWTYRPKRSSTVSMSSGRKDQSSPRQSRCHSDLKTKAVLDRLDVVPAYRPKQSSTVSMSLGRQDSRPKQSSTVSMLSRRTDQSSPRQSRCRPDVKTKAVLDSLDVILT